MKTSKECKELDTYKIQSKPKFFLENVKESHIIIKAYLA